MPRSGLAAADVVRAGAEIADELGYHRLTLGLLAQRLGIRSPSLYKHVSGLGDLQHRIATLAMTEFGEMIRDAVAGLAGRDALSALANAARGTWRRIPAATWPPWALSSPVPATLC